ncbi:MAG: GNAT family N-acetyltransferase [Victivallales bacterium]|nr:GNAT family N-acetyltransferase [Victivallales bacterium]
MHQLKIIPATAAELHEIEALARKIWPFAYGEILSREQVEYMLDHMYDQNTMKQELQNGTRFDLLLCENRAIGFISYGPPDERQILKLHKLYLLPEYHHLGYGSAALRHVITEAGKMGCVAVDLCVNKRNERALRSYRRNGFEIVEAIVTPFGNGFVMDDYLMRHTLS